jgi:hypothetical protein
MAIQILRFAQDDSCSGMYGQMTGGAFSFLDRMFGHDVGQLPFASLVRMTDNHFY